MSSTATQAGSIQQGRDGHHLALTIHNPARRNALNLAMWQQLSAALSEAAQDRTLRLITLRGHAGTFVSGADISQFEETRSTAEQAAAYEMFNGAAFAALRQSPIPTLALIEGFCFGGGVGLAAACDMRLASHTARFAVPAAKLGLAYPVAGVRDLVHLIGPGFTKKLFLTGEPIDAQSALRIGLVEQMVPGEDFEAEADRLIQTILARAPLTHRATKSAVAAALDPSLIGQANADAAACFASADYAEGRQAFLAKRPARFTGT